MQHQEILATLALSFLKGVGPITSRLLIAYTGNAQAVFLEKPAKLAKIPGIGLKIIGALKDSKAAWDAAEKELNFTIKHRINVYAYHAPNFPQRLKQCTDAPLVFFLMGNVNLEQSKVISVVGTRNATEYGRALTDKLLLELTPFNPLIISGLAYGIDIEAHKSALRHRLPTVGVMGTGLDTIYPAKHKQVAAKMLEQNGGLLTEFCYGSKPERENFPMRNRLIAGLCDALIVVEASKTGGALITARLANEYNREVFAFPGRVNDSFSEGCNNLILNNSAILLQNTSDLIKQMNWDSEKPNKGFQKQLFVDLSESEEKIYSLLQNAEFLSLDQLVLKSQLSPAIIQAELLAMEFKGLIKQIPGKLFKLA